MFNITKADERHIEELAELRSMVLMETNNLTDFECKNEFKNSNLAYLKEAIPSGQFVAWIAIVDGKIVATSGIVFYTIAPCKSVPNGQVGYVQNMYTLKEYRRQGIAKILFEKTLDEAKKMGCTKVMLNATKEGRPLYESFGFTDAENEMEYKF